MIDEYILKNILNTDLYDLETYVSYDKYLTFYSIKRSASQISPNTSTEVSGQIYTLKVYEDINNK
jgi:hypothetical protein